MLRSRVATIVCSFVLICCAAVRAGTPVNVVLLGGQSNMDGWAYTANLPANLQQPQNDVLFYRNAATPTLQALAPASLNGQCFGPEITFGRAIADAKPTEKFAIIKHAVGGTSLGNANGLANSWYPSGGQKYADFKSTVNSGLTALTNAGYTPHVVGMLWLQGENDSALLADANAYQQNLTNLIGDVRANYGANLPFIIGGIGSDGQTSMPYRNTVQSAFSSVAGTLSNVRYFSNDDLNPNRELHFNGIQMQTIGTRFAAELRSVPEPSSMITLGTAALLLFRRPRRRI